LTQSKKAAGTYLAPGKSKKILFSSRLEEGKEKAK
jgi:hypothetical protein